MKLPTPLLLLLIASTLAPRPRAIAQPTPPSDSASQASGLSSDQASLLNPFEVSAPKDNGYVATDSTLGSRVATPIKDLPFSVEIVTSQLMEDFGMFEMDENVSFVSSFVGLSQGGQYQLRGFNQSYSLEDGFIRLGRYGTINVDRIEVIKGPSAAIYGEATPGGTINIVTKEPSPTPSQSVTVNGGSYNSGRALVDVTGPITSKTNYLVIVGDYSHSYDVAFAKLRNEEAYIDIQHIFDSSSSLDFKFDYSSQTLDAEQQILPENYDSVNKVYTGTLAYNLADLSRTGPDSWHDRAIESYTLDYEKQFNDVWSLRFGANAYTDNYNDFNNGVSEQYDIYAHTISRGTPAENRWNEAGDGIQADLVAHYKLFKDTVENRDLFTIDLNDYYKWRLQDSLESAYAVAPYFNKTITVGVPDFNYTLPPFNLGQYSVVSGDDYKNRGIDDAWMFRHQSTLFKGKLLLFASAREDYLDINLHSIVPAIVQHYTNQYFEPSAGFNYKIVPNVALYGSYSTSYDANIQGVTASTNPPNPATTGIGKDYGVKCNLLDNRLIFTLGGYYINKENVTVPVLQSDGSTIDVPEGTQLNRGVEFDFTYAVYNNLQFGGGMGHVNAKVTSDGENTETIGRGPANNPANNIGVYGRYQFSGLLKNLYTNLSYTYISPSHPDGPTTGDTLTKGVYTSSNYEWYVKIPSYYYFDWAWHYQLPNFKGFNQSLDFVVKNLLNRFYVNSADYVALGRGYYVGYTIKH